MKRPPLHLFKENLFTCRPILFSFVSVLALGFIILIYANSFKGTWQYDDLGNIVENEKIHLDSLSWKGLYESFFATPVVENSLQRPLAFLTFGLNYRWGGLNPWGYHLVNLIIHLTTSVVLFAFVLEMLQIPHFRAEYEENAPWIALVAVMLWATHPIQVTAITYIVQRMASMASLFAILSMYLYLKARLVALKYKRYVYLILAFLSFLVGLTVKENVVLIPICALILELGPLGGLDRFSSPKATGITLAILLLVVLLIAAVMGLEQVELTTRFPNRPYTPFQRLLTEPRVIGSYLAWIFIPMSSHLSLLHDIDVSVDMLTPPITLPAMVLIWGGTILLLCLLHRYPLPVFCFLFFMVNHLVEASFLNLGLAYEHRNYLPSMLLFVPFSIWGFHLWKRNRQSRRLRFGFSAALAILILSNGHMVYQYNKVFVSELSLWLDVSLKSPGLSVSHNNLGKALWDLGAYEKANEEFVLAMKLDRWLDSVEKGMIHHNLGLYQAYLVRDYHAALDHFQEAVKYMNGNPATWYQLARAYLMVGKTAEAQKTLAHAILGWPKEKSLLVLMAVIQLHAGNEKSALEWTEKVQLIYPQDRKISILKAEIYRRIGNQLGAEQSTQAYLSANRAEKPKVDLLSININKEGRISPALCLQLLELAGIDGNIVGQAINKPNEDAKLSHH